jgi:glutathione S-transferase
MRSRPRADGAAQDDDGFVLYQSRAICRYIAAKVGTPLIPTGDIKAEARYEQAVQIEASEYDGDVQKLVFQRVFTPMFGGTPDEALVQQLAARLEGKIRVYEQILSKQKYLAGDNLTMADLYHLPFGVYLAPQGFKWFEDKEKYPNLAR